MKQKIIVMASAFGLLMVFFAAAYMYVQKKNQHANFMAQENAEVFVRPGSMIKGPQDAKVYIVEFLDPACETCGAFYPLVKEMMAKHPGRTKLVIRYAPFHQGSDTLVRMLEASRKQDKFWLALETMLSTQSMWADHNNPQPQLVWELLSRAGIDTQRLEIDMNDPAIEARLRQDLADVETLGVRQTPQYFVNGKPLDPFGVEPLQALIDEQVKLAYE